MSAIDRLAHRSEDRRSGTPDGRIDGVDLLEQRPNRCTIGDIDPVFALWRCPHDSWLADETMHAIAAENNLSETALDPDFALLAVLHPRGAVVTAPGRDVDFVSRYFVPSYGIPEDPVTGSIHAALTPFCSKRLGKPRLNARQLSRRGGELVCSVDGERVRVGGRAVAYLEGTICVP